MKKVVSLFATLILSFGSILAQTNYRSVKGYVIDKNGNPIPGAEVTTLGGGESVITDSDGSFSLSVHPLLEKLTASYDGMTTKTLKILPERDLVFRLKKQRNNPAFLNANVGYIRNMQYGYYDPTNGESWGIMAGMLSKWGFYGKATCDCYGELSITAGVIKSVYRRNIFIYAGTGFGTAKREYNQSFYMNRYDWSCSDIEKRPGIAGDLGFIFKIGRHFNLTIGANIIRTFPFHGKAYYIDYYKKLPVGSNYVFGAQVGFGYVF